MVRHYYIDSSPGGAKEVQMIFLVLDNTNDIINGASQKGEIRAV